MTGDLQTKRENISRLEKPKGIINRALNTPVHLYLLLLNKFYFLKSSETSTQYDVPSLFCGELSAFKISLYFFPFIELTGIPLKET